MTYHESSLKCDPSSNSKQVVGNKTSCSKCMSSWITCVMQPIIGLGLQEGLEIHQLNLRIIIYLPVCA